MAVDESRRALGELELLASRLSGERPVLPRAWPRARRILEQLAVASWAEQDELLLGVFGARPGEAVVGRPVAAALVALRMGGVDAAEAALLGEADLEALAEQRLHNPEGRSLRVQILRLAECRRERLDGSGPLGLTAAQLDAAARCLAAAWAFVKEGGGLRGLARVAGRPDLYDAEALIHAVSAFPIGTYVKLSSGQLGRVVGVNAADPLRPLVCARVSAGGAVLSPPVLQNQDDAPRIISILDEPLAEAPAPEEQPQSWLQRLAAAAPFRETPFVIPERLAGDWGPAVRETDRRWAREEDRRRQALFDRLAAALEQAVLAHSRRALEDEAVILAEEARAIQARLTERAAEQAAAVEDGRAAALEREQLRVSYYAALERIGLERRRVEDALTALHIVNLERLWESKVSELASLWRELSERRAERERRRRKREEDDKTISDRLKRRVEMAKALRAAKAARLRARAEETIAAAEQARQEAARLHDLARPWADAAAALAEEREIWLAGAPEREAERGEHEKRLEAVQADIVRFKQALTDLDRTQLDEAVQSREAMETLRKELAAQLKSARRAAGLPELRRRLRQAEGALQAERARALEREKAAEAERAAAAEALKEARARAGQQGQRWDQERRGLQARIVERRRELDALRKREAEELLRKESAQAAGREGLAAFEQAAAEQIVRVRRALTARREALERRMAALPSAQDEAEVIAAFEERRSALQEEVKRLRGELGDAQGLIAAGEAERTALRQSLQAALSELDLRLLESNFALDNARKEAEALVAERDRRRLEWERGARELEGLSARFEELAGKIEPLLSDAAELGGQGLEGVSAVFREQLLSRARELSLWDARLAEVDRKLKAARSAYAAQLFVRAKETALRALREGRLEDAKSALRQALSLQDDAELRELLRKHEA